MPVGMGTVAPKSRIYGRAFSRFCNKNILEPTVKGIKDKALDFVGIIFLAFWYKIINVIC